MKDLDPERLAAYRAMKHIVAYDTISDDWRAGRITEQEAWGYRDEIFPALDTVPPPPCGQEARTLCKEARSYLGLSQERFAETFRLSLGAVRNWELGKARGIDRPSMALLRIIHRVPDAALWAMAPENVEKTIRDTGGEPIEDFPKRSQTSEKQGKAPFSQ